MRPRLAALVLLLCTACIVKAPSNGGASKVDSKKIPPMAAVKSQAILGGKLALLGATFQPGEVIPGRPTRVALYFQVLDTIDRDYWVFVHVEDPDGVVPRTNIDHPPAGGQYPTSRWQKGQRIRDEFTLQVPEDTKLRAVTLWVGLWDPKTDERMPLTNPQVVRNDGKNRILLTQVPVAGR